METWSLIYRGPAITEDPERAGRVRDALAARYPLTAAEAGARLEQVPFSLISGISKGDAERRALFLRALGAEVEVVSEEMSATESGHPTIWEFPEPESRPSVRSGMRALLYAFAPGLSLAGVILAAGAAQIVGAWYLFASEGPFWPLSASGWATIGAALFIFTGLLIARLPVIVHTLERPRLNSPLTTLCSFFTALNTRHWDKAWACLCWREGETVDREAVIGALKAMRRRFVLPEGIDPRSSGFVALAETAAALRFALPLVDRVSQSDGTRLRRTLVDVRRFALRQGRWYLCDPWILGQVANERVPAPACRVCGVEVTVGERTCPACDTPLPPWDIASEDWLPARRKPDLAALLSAFVPGLGQTYNGQPVKGALIAATSWMILPWAAGVVDAIFTAERVNRRSSVHETSRRPGLAMAIHVLLFAVAVTGALYYAEQLPLVREIIIASRPTPEELSQSPILARFRGADGNYSILFPWRWQVSEIPDPVPGGADDRAAVRGASRDGLSTIIISTRPRPAGWNPCPQAMQARNMLEADGALIANVECGSRGGRDQYRVDSFSTDREWRRTMLVLAFERELVIIAFACPAAQHETMAAVFDEVTESIRYAQNRRDTIRK